jgi:hypothetical protein
MSIKGNRSMTSFAATASIIIPVNGTALVVEAQGLGYHAHFAGGRGGPS